MDALGAGLDASRVFGDCDASSLISGLESSLMLAGISRDCDASSKISLFESMLLLRVILLLDAVLQYDAGARIDRSS